MINRDHEYTLRIAETAMDKIKALSLPADPPAYELWYDYAAAHDPELNRSINDALETTGQLSIQQLDEIYNRHIAPTRIQSLLNDAGATVSSEVDKVIGLLDEFILSTSQGRDGCVAASAQLAQPVDARTVRAIADALIKSLMAVETRSAAIEQKLNAAKAELDSLQGALAIKSIEASRDPLTGLVNRREFERAIDQATNFAGRTAAPLSLLMIDIDEFKVFNDRYGHVTGDSVLRLVATVLRQSIKGQDIAARYGGEEFAVILPNTTLRNAEILANQLCYQVAKRELKRRSTGESLGLVTVSIGVAAFRRGELATTLIERADAALYGAKRAGRGCAKCERQPDSQLTDFAGELPVPACGESVDGTAIF